MKFTTIILGLVAGFFAQQSLCLQKTQEQAHKFLIDNGQVSADSQVQSFTLDRTGNVRIRLIEGDYALNFGLEEDQDTYNVVYMNKKKQVAPVLTATPGTASQKDQLAKRIGQKLSILKGGKVTQIRRPTAGSRGGKSSDVEVEVKVGTKTYTVNGQYNQKLGDFTIRGVQDGALKPVVASEL